jgi:RNA polymerase sigma-70 factor (ECF subfamily)
VQETFFRVFTKAASYKNKYRFSTWLYQIALNLCRDHGRSQSIRQFFSLPSGNAGEKIHEALSHHARIEENYESDEEVRELHRQISKLPHKLKSALILYALEEKSQAHCSSILGISEKAVETRVYRAKKILSQKMS